MGITQQLNKVINVFRYQSLVPVFSDLRAQEIPYALLKGEALSLLAYGEIGKRSSSDVDILIQKENLDRLEGILANAGFYPARADRAARIAILSFSHQAVTYYKDSVYERITVDLNYDIFWGEYEGVRTDISAFLQDSIEITLYGCKVRTLSPMKAFIQLVLHHYKDMNSIYLLATRNSIRPSMFADIYHLLMRNKTMISCRDLLQRGRELGILPYLYYVLYYTNQIYEDPELELYISACKTPEGEALLPVYGLTAEERRNWKVDFKTRLEEESIYTLIQEDLTKGDLKKIQFNQTIFGV